MELEEQFVSKNHLTMLTSLIICLKTIGEDSGAGNPPVKNSNCGHPDWSIPGSCDPCGY